MRQTDRQTDRQTRSRLCGVLIAAGVLLVPTLGFGTGLTPGAQVGASRASVPGPGHDRWTIWARQADGTIVYKRDEIGSHVWYDPNPFPVPQVVVNANGVSATGWSRFGTVYERGYYVGAGAPYWIYEYQLVNGSNGGQIYGYPPPPGLTPTGHIAASHRRNPDVMSTVLVYATFTDGSLWALKIDGWGILPATWEPLATGISTTAPIAASESPEETISRVFATVNANHTVVTRRFDGAFSATKNIGKPSGGQIDVCATAAAAEGWVGPTTYMIYLFCSAFPGSAANREDLHYAYSATTPTSDAFAWGRGDLGPGETALNSGYAIAARARPDAGYNAIDVYLLDTATSATKLFHFEHDVLGAALGTVQSLGADPETSRRLGGLTATAQPTHYSDVYFLGRTDLGDRLYRRLGDENESAALAKNWTYHQSGSPTADIATTGALTESSSAVFKGRAMNVAILESANRSVVARVSDNDGDTWGAPTTLSNGGYSYVTDPTVDFSNTGDAYISLFGITHAQPFCDSTPTTTASGIYYVKRRASDGTYLNPVMLATDGPVAPQVSRWDHPWVAINRADNRVHFIWTDRGVDRLQGNIQYAQSTNDVFVPVALRDNSLQGNPLVSNFQYPTVVTVGAAGTTYVAWASGICRINAARNGCAAVGTIPGDHRPELPPQGLEFAGTASRVDAGSHSFVASPTQANVVYYAFQRFEDDGTEELDSFLSVITFDPVGLTFTFSPAVRLAPEILLDDDTNQFSPEITVSQDDASGETIFANWYDTRASGGGPCVQTNRCYLPRHSTSVNSGASFSDSQRICLPIDDSPQGPTCTGTDPDLLPGFCGSVGDIRFVGDYHFVTGDVLHSFQTLVVSPTGGPVATGRLLRGTASRGYWNW